MVVVLGSGKKKAIVINKIVGIVVWILPPVTWRMPLFDSIIVSECSKVGATTKHCLLHINPLNTQVASFSIPETCFSQLLMVKLSGSPKE